MKGPVRAKFRALRITQTWDDKWEIELGPVMQRGENSAENKSFWEASPSGECKLTYNKEHPFKAGSYYYIDMVPSEDGQWKMGSVSKHGSGSGEIHMSHYRSYDHRDVPKGLLHGHLQIYVDGAHTKALDTFGEPDELCNVTFTFAEESDGDSAY